MDKRFTFFVMGVVIALLFNAIACDDHDDSHAPDSNDVIKTDTVYVDRVINLPGKTETFIDSVFIPKIIYKPDQELLDRYNELQTDNDRLQAYIDAITLRTYQNSYVSSDSLVKITVTDSVTGKLNSQKVSFDIAPREITIQEKIITNDVYKYPDFSISLGVGIKVPAIPGRAQSFEGVLGIEDRRGFQYQLGVDTRKEFRLTITKKLWTKF